MSTRWFGTSVLRKEDDRLLRGAARYVADIALPDMVHVAFVRSPHPSARLRGVVTRKAMQAPGVVDVVTHRDLGEAGAAFPQLLPHHGLVSATWCALADGAIRFSGEAVAAVAADTALAAQGAAELVEVDYEPMAPVLDVEAAVRAESPLVHAAAPRNIAMHLVEEKGDVESGLRNAPQRLKERFWLTRGAGMPLETRGVVAQYDHNRRELTIWSSTQEPHTVRNTVADLLALPRHMVRVIAPDTGGGFGTKINVNPEELLVAWLAMRLQRPVKWIESRSEHMLAAPHEREQVHYVEVGFDGTGRVHALKNTFYHDMGAYAPRGGAVPHNTSSAIVGPYRIAHVRSEILAVYTNKVTVSAYRGAGQPQGVFVIERVMDRIAQKLDLDPAEVRRTNTIPNELFPYDTGLTNLLGGAVEYDSGNFIGTLDKAIDAAGYSALREEQRKARASGRYFGIGIANYVELTGRGPWEGGGVRVEPDGSATVYTGAPTQGQGIETTLAQICADQLGLAIDKVSVRAGDTTLIAHGIGTFASRIGVLAGNAVRESSIEVKEKILRIAEDMLEVAAADLVINDGVVSIAGVPERSIHLSTIAKKALKASGPRDEAPGLEAVKYFKAPKMTYSNGTHLAVVEVDADTGTVSIVKYVVAHDCGRMINPMVVEGQIMGGVACGIGNALLEEHRYDDQGQLLTGSFMDYALPMAASMPVLDIVHQETPSTLNPLGVKGAGEAGTIPVPAAIAAAVEDALRPLGTRINIHPLTPNRLWALIQSSNQPERS